MKMTSHFISDGSTNRFIHWLICATILMVCSAAMPQTPSPCETELKTAEQKYLDGYLDEAMGLLNRCLNKPSATNQDSAEAYKLLGKIYIAKENRQEAKKAFWMMLMINPAANLEPATETAEVMLIFYEVKAALEKQRQPPEEVKAAPGKQQQPPEATTPAKQGRSKKWIWIGAGGAAAVGAAVAVLGGGGGGNGGRGNGGFVAPPGRPPR